MNILGLRPEDEEDPLAPIKGPELPALSVAAPQVLQVDTASTGGATALSPPPMAGPGPMGGMVQLPEKTIRSDTSVNTREKSAGVVDEQAAERKAFEARLAAADREQAAVTEGATKEAQIDEQKAAWARHYEGERARAMEERGKEIQARMAAADQRRQEMEVAAKPATFWENPGAPSRVVASFLTGIGDAFGHGSASKELDKQLAEDRQLKLDKFTRSKEFHALAKADVGAAQEALSAKLQEIRDTEEVRIKVLDRELAVIAKKTGIPKAQAAYEKWRAEQEEKFAGNRATEEAEYDRKITRSGGTTTNINKDGAGPKGDGLTARTSAEGSRASAESLGRLEELIKGNPKSWANLQAAAKSQMESDATSGEGLNKFLRWTGVVPSAIEQRLPKDDAVAREMNSLMGTLETAKAREMDPVGAIDKSVRENARDKLGILTRTPEEMAAEVGKYKTRYERQAEAAVPGSAGSKITKRHGIETETKEMGGITYQRVGNTWKKLKAGK